jgi:hypothetical protein
MYLKGKVAEICGRHIESVFASALSVWINSRWEKVQPLNRLFPSKFPACNNVDNTGIQVTWID